MAVIALFTLLFTMQQLMPVRVQRTTPLRQINTIQRFLSSRAYRISFLNWNSAPLGVLILGFIGFLFFFLMVLVPQPYYWPAIDEGMYGHSPALATRSGWLSLACLPFVIATAGRSNMSSSRSLLASLTKVSACSLPTVTTASSNAEFELVFLIQPRGGFTARLLKLAQQDRTELAVTLDGPYGGVEMSQLAKSDRIVLIAGGSGAGWILPMVTGYLRRLQDSPQTANEKQGPLLQVVLSSRDRHTLEWFRESLNALLAEHQVDGRAAGINVNLHYTGSLSQCSSNTDQDVEKSAYPEVCSADSQQSSLSALYSYSDQRPNLPAFIESNVGSAQDVETTSVFVCGPLSMQHDVGNSVAKQQLKALKGGKAEMTLHMEHFSSTWA